MYLKIILLYILSKYYFEIISNCTLIASLVRKQVSNSFLFLVCHVTNRMRVKLGTIELHARANISYLPSKTFANNENSQVISQLLTMLDFWHANFLISGHVANNLYRFVIYNSKQSELCVDY